MKKDYTEKENTWFWLDMDYHYGDFSETKVALMKSVRDDDGDVEAKVIAWTSYDNIGVTHDEYGDNLDESWKKIDVWIESELGFLPDYEVN